MIIRNHIPEDTDTVFMSFEEEGFLAAFALDVAFDKDFPEILRVKTCVEHHGRGGHRGRGKILDLIHIQTLKSRIPGQSLHLFHPATRMA